MNKRQKFSNAIVIKVGNHMHLFKLDENGQILNPSIVIDNSLDGAYDYVTENHLLFIFTDMKDKIQDGERYSTHIISSFILDKPIIEIMKEGKLQTTINEYRHLM